MTEQPYRSRGQSNTPDAIKLASSERVESTSNAATCLRATALDPVISGVGLAMAASETSI
jgi:hypothetical protein